MTVFRLGILGCPLGHTLSPLLHQLFFEATSTQGSYKPFEIPPEEISFWMQNWKTHYLSGFNVTIPYKVEVIPFLKEVSEEAGLMGAVNTVIVKKDGLYGDNTDIYGFAAALEPSFLQGLASESALILGAGGASRAVAYALLKHGIGSLTFWVRNRDRAATTLNSVAGVNNVYRGGQVPVNLELGLSPADMAQFKCVINTSPVGMHPHDKVSPLSVDYLEKLPREALVYDLIYNPLETQLLRTARRLGLKSQDGLDMLIHQGARSFELWTGQAVSASVITTARQKLRQSIQPKV